MSPSITTSSTFSGSVTFESTTPGGPDYFGAITALGFTVGSLTGTLNPGGFDRLLVLNGPLPAPDWFHRRAPKTLRKVW